MVRKAIHGAVTRAGFWLACSGYGRGDGVLPLGPSAFLQEITDGCRRVVVARRAGRIKAEMVSPGTAGGGMVSPGTARGGMVSPGTAGGGMVNPGTAGDGTAGGGTSQAGPGGRRPEVRGSPDGTAAVAGPLAFGPVMRWLVTREPAVRRAPMPRPAIGGRARAVSAGPRRVTSVLAVPALGVAGVAVLGGVLTRAAIDQIAVAAIAVVRPRIPGSRVARLRMV